MRGGQRVSTSTRRLCLAGRTSVPSARLPALPLTGAKSATVVVGSSLIAHVVAGGGLPSVATLAVLFGIAAAGCTVVVAVLRQRRARAPKVVLWRLSVGLVATQLVVHAALGPGRHDHAGTAVAHSASAQPLPSPSADGVSSLLVMCLAHLVAVAVATGLLAYGARLASVVRVWMSASLARARAGACVVLPRLRFPRPERRRTSGSNQLWHGHCASRRGPPAPAIAGC